MSSALVIWCATRAIHRLGGGLLLSRQGCDAMAPGRGVLLTYAEPPGLNATTVELGERVLVPESN